MEHRAGSLSEAFRRPLLLLIGIIAIIIIVMGIGFDDISRIITRITLSQLIALTLLQLGTLYLTSYIWYLLLREKGAAITPHSVFWINMAGTFVESITPSVKLGGEAMKIYLMKKKSSLSYRELAAVAVAGKFFYLLPFLLISLGTIAAGFLLLDLPPVVYLAFAGLLLICGLFYAFCFHTGGGKLLAGIRDTVPGGDSATFTKIASRLGSAHAFLKDSSEMAAALITTPKKSAAIYLLAFIVWAFYPVKVYLVAYMLGYEISPLVIIIATFTAYLVSMVPLLPGGLVTFEATMALVLVSGGMILSEAAAIALVTRLITFWIPLMISAAATLFFIREMAPPPVPGV